MKSIGVNCFAATRPRGSESKGTCRHGGIEVRLAQSDTRWWRETPPVSRWLLLAGVLWGLVAIAASLSYVEPMNIIVFLIVNTGFLPIFFIWQWLAWRARKRSAEVR